MLANRCTRDIGKRREETQERITVMGNLNGKVYWSELMTRDFKAAKDYYSEVLGWTYKDMEGMGGRYTIAHLDDQPVAGIGDSVAMQLPEEIPSHWMTYIAVDDIDAAVEKTTATGGTIKNMPFDVPGVGKIAIIQDPSGAVFGLTQPLT